ncbi:MAG TPA: lipocalin-like domain-containing protein [Allosphingosinicella sp.]|nr:lipocalin-like domain-containing protein [Allosphingosinicella sp.]
MSLRPKPRKPSAKALQKRLVGTWKLMSAEDRASPKDPWKPGTFGTPPSGYFIYDATGHCSVQIMTVPPVKLATPDSPTPAEALEIFNGYIAYYGTYTVADGMIHQQVEGAWDPSQVDTDQARPFELKDEDTLIIGDQVTYRRTLKRVC